MKSVGERIKYLRKDYLNKTQKDFGSQIGIKPNSVSDIESGKNNPTEQTIKAICREFGINEDWLRYEKEPIEIPVNSDDRYSHNLAKLAATDDETIMNWVNMIAETNPDVLKEIEEFMKKLLGIED